MANGVVVAQTFDDAEFGFTCPEEDGVISSYIVYVRIPADAAKELFNGILACPTSPTLSHKEPNEQVCSLEEVRREMEKTTRYLTLMNASRSQQPIQPKPARMPTSQPTSLRSFETPKGTLTYTLYMPEDCLVFQPIHELSLKQPLSTDIYPLIDPSHTLDSKTSCIIAQLARGLTSMQDLRGLAASFCSVVLPRLPVHSPELWKTKQMLLSQALKGSGSCSTSPIAESPTFVRSGSSMTEW